MSIDVPDPWRTQIRDVRRKVGDPWADEIPPHITVIGPSVIDAALLPELWTHLDQVAAETGAFGVLLKGTGSFRPVSPVVFLNVVEGDSNCRVLERRARTGPLAQPLRFDYHPHVTVAHEVNEAALDRAAFLLRDFEARFRVSALWLHELCDDGVWRRRRRCELRWA